MSYLDPKTGEVSGRNNIPSSNNDITVEDKRSIIYKVWSKHKVAVLITIIGVGFFAYLKNKI